MNSKIKEPAYCPQCETHYIAMLDVPYTGRGKLHKFCKKCRDIQYVWDHAESRSIGKQRRRAARA